MVVVGLLQMEPERSKDLAYGKLVEFASEAGSQGAELVCTPEYNLTSFEGHAESDAESIPGPTTAKLTKLANRKDIYIVAHLLEKDGSHLYSSAVLIGPKHQGLVGKYRKVHLRGRRFTPGDGFPVFDAGGFRIGMMLCCDKDFPESTRELRLSGADLVVSPSACDTVDMKDFEESILRVRAWENMVYIVSVNPAGDDFLGNSIAVNFAGDIMLRMGPEEGIGLADIRIDKLRRFEKSSLIYDRQPHAYRSLLVQWWPNTTPPGTTPL